ncbi:MAG: YtxH domain-containing protein [Bacteroidales bacterium]|jgi:gas vesicle protein|nr:YtxH domain-containing protein [Bacteroidales bacterium]MDD4529445.1 YtxH domain-containing protein [Bacteroidales bacterium]MDD4828910.1 YtxH domain-containing protein [Bacteroidales bacterium]
MNTGKIVLGVVAGIAVGSLLGVLFAPEKGSTTRKKICRKGQDDIDTLKEKFNDFIDGISEKFEKVKEEVKDFSEDVKNRSEEKEKEFRK